MAPYSIVIKPSAVKEIESIPVGKNRQRINLHVRSHIRGQGLGRQLFAKAARWVMVKQPGWPIHAWVFEANDSARRFYDTVKGEILEREVKQMPGGARVPSLRYVWRDLRILVNHLTHRSSGRADAPG